MKKARYIQIGVTALRDAEGNFLPSVPLYILSNEDIEESGMTASEENLMHDISGIFYDAHARLHDN